MVFNPVNPVDPVPKGLAAFELPIREIRAILSKNSLEKTQGIF
jgi:hypothetical protein